MVAKAHPTHDGSGKQTGLDLVAEQLSPGGVPTERLGPQRCEDGKAGTFPCHEAKVTLPGCADVDGGLLA